MNDKRPQETVLEMFAAGKVPAIQFGTPLAAAVLPIVWENTKRYWAAVEAAQAKQK